MVRHGRVDSRLGIHLCAVSLVRCDNVMIEHRAESRRLILIAASAHEKSVARETVGAIAGSKVGSRAN